MPFASYNFMLHADKRCTHMHPMSLSTHTSMPLQPMLAAVVQVSFIEMARSLLPLFTLLALWAAQVGV